MKSPRLIFLSVSSLALFAVIPIAGCSKSAEPAKSAIPAVPAAGISPTAANISNHLELGGEFYAVMDTKGDVEEFGNLIADYADFGYKQATGNMGDNAPKLDFRALFKKLGLYDIDGLGLSSWKGADGLHHNRGFLYTPDERTGLLKIFGDKPGPFVTPSLAPADADFAYESTIDLKSLYDLLISYAQDVKGAAGVQQVTHSLSITVPETTITGQYIIDHLNTRVVVIARADPKQVLEAGPGVKIPMTDVLIALDGFSDVFDQLEVMFKDNPMFTLGEKNGMKTITIDAPVPDSFAAYKPQIIADPKSKRLYLVSRASFADETIFGQGPRLSSSDDFKAATDGLPTEGNALNYFSKKGAAAFVEFYDKQIMAQAQMPDNLRERLIAFGGLDKIPHGLAGTRVNLPEGIMFQFTSTHSAKEVVAMAPIAGVGLVAAMAIPAFSKVRQQSREKAVLNNLRQLSSAAQQYMLEKGVRSASYHDLVGTSTDNYLRNVAPVADEDYTGFHMNQSDTQITVSGSFGTVTFNQ